MRKYIDIVFLIVMTFTTGSCSHDDAPSQPEDKTLNAYVCQVKNIDCGIELSSTATYHWFVDSTSSALYSLPDTTAKEVPFVAAVAGKYHLKVIATDNGEQYINHITINVDADSSTPSPYISNVFDVLPAPGQFINQIPAYKSGDTKDSIVNWCKKAVVGVKNGGLISLGGFGGYIVFGFDHTIVNVAGRRDLRIMGNAFYASANPNTSGKKGGSCEPGIVMVAYDKNKNGKPDDDEWYEIAGSEYNNPATIHNYQITYSRPTTETKDADASGYTSIKKYIYWIDNQGNSGYKIKNIYHNQSYYPGWITDDKLTFSGTLLPDNAVDESGKGTYWVLYAYGYGYVDNAPNTDDDSAIDIDWAVDAKGNKVHLPGIDFVKVYCGMNQEAGWLGETSTEVAGAYDLHLAGENIATVSK
jgi:hypothetical protein